MYWVRIRHTDKSVKPMCAQSKGERVYYCVSIRAADLWRRLVITTERDASNPQSNTHPGGICPWRRDRNPLTPTETERLCNSAPSNLTPIVYDEFFHFHRLDYPAVSALCVYVCLYVCIKLHCVENQTLKSILILRYMYLSTSVVFRDNIVLSISH